MARSLASVPVNRANRGAQKFDENKKFFCSERTYTLHDKLFPCSAVMAEVGTHPA
jgi:hypothetical protein